MKLPKIDTQIDYNNLALWPSRGCVSREKQQNPKRATTISQSYRDS